MNISYLLIICSLIVIFAYLLDIWAKQIKVPAVMVIIGMGIGFKYTMVFFNIRYPDAAGFLEIFGTIGLILIVLEGTLELNIDRTKISLIKNALAAAAGIMMINIIAITGIIRLMYTGDSMSALVNALPLSVISSAIVIPSVVLLPEAKREFLIYESVLSDIFGVILFNIISADVPWWYHLASIVLVCLIAIVFCFFLGYLLYKVSHRVKSFLIMAILILIYALGKKLHLSSLLIILSFGLFLNNMNNLRLPQKIKSIFHTDSMLPQVSEFKLITFESAFIIRTFFFFLFGFMVNLDDVFRPKVIVAGLFIVGCIWGIRLVYYRIYFKLPLYLEAGIAPRGLITILLFASIAPDKIIPGFGNGILLFIIFGTGIIMSLTLMIHKPEAR